MTLSNLIWFKNFTPIIIYAILHTDPPNLMAFLVDEIGLIIPGLAQFFLGGRYSVPIYSNCAIVGRILFILSAFLSLNEAAVVFKSPGGRLYQLLCIIIL